MDASSMSTQQLLIDIADLDKKMHEAIEQTQWDALAILEKDYKERIYHVIAAAQQQDPQLLCLIKDIVQSHAVLQKKVQHRYRQLAQVLITVNQGHEMRRTYQSIVQIEK